MSFRWTTRGRARVASAVVVAPPVALEARGFLFGAAIASRLQMPLHIARKPGKLPRQTVRHSYALEYGDDGLELHADAFPADTRCAIVDDVLATVGYDADAIAAYLKKNHVKDDDDSDAEELGEFDDAYAEYEAYGDDEDDDADNYDVNDPNIRLLVEAAIAAYLDKFGYEGKTLDQIRAEFPTSFSLLAFYQFILPDTEEPDKDDLYTETDVYNEIGAEFP